MRFERTADGVRLMGRLDFDTVPEFLNRVAGELGTSGARRLDLSGVERIDSAGVAALLWLKQDWEGRGIDLQLASMPRQGRAMAEVAGVAGLLENRG